MKKVLFAVVGMLLFLSVFGGCNRVAVMKNPENSTDEMFSDSKSDAEIEVYIKGGRAYTVGMDYEIPELNGYDNLEEGRHYLLTADVTYLNGGVAGYVDYPQVERIISIEEIPTEETADQTWQAQEELMQMAPEDIKSIRYSTATEDGYREGETTDQEIIQEIREYICGASLGNSTDMGVTDADLNVEVILEDKVLSFFFEYDILVLEQKRYQVNGVAPLRQCVEVLLAEDDTEEDKSGTLVVYFSTTGTTKGVAEIIADIEDADLYEILPAIPYTDDDRNWHDSESRTTKEQNDPSFRPEIASEAIDISGYTKIYVGFPIWWGQEPRIMDTFVENYDFGDATMIPFCTSASSGIGDSGTNLKKLAGSGIWMDGARFGGNASESDIREWIDSLMGE